jgi:Cu-Zn family superoxide dismutase
MRRIAVGLATCSGVLLALSGTAMASLVQVDHGHGPTVVHDLAYAQVHTQVHAWGENGATRVRLMVAGMPPSRTFGAHVHVNGCGSDPLASGGHYQHGSPTMPVAEREVWLDFTTDSEGRGTGTSTTPWLIEPGSAGSVVVHASPTNPSTGAAGARLFCTDVPFGIAAGHSEH